MPYIYQLTRLSDYYVSFGRERYIAARSPSPEIIERVREPVFYQVAERKKSHPEGTDTRRYKKLKQELNEARREMMMAEKQKGKAGDWEEYKEAEKEYKELGDKVKWIEKKMDAEFRKVMKDD